MSAAWKLSTLGDSAVVVTFGDAIDEAVYRQVQRMADLLERHPFPGLVEWVPAFCSITVVYDPLQLTVSDVTRQLQRLWSLPHDCDPLASNAIDIPVCYCSECGPDLEWVADFHGLTVEAVIDLHVRGTYRVYMIGFLPGFPYLGGLSPALATPRKQQPRLQVPAGSVGLAGAQTGIYPVTSPGGWQIIGRTPVSLFNPERTPPTRLQPGTTVRFERISHATYLALREDTP
jgi:inhibitor of KinA